MNQIASPAQLRMSLIRWALFIIPTIMFLGFLAGQISGSGEENRWYQALVKPDMMPAGWVFGLAWSILYFMIGLAFSMILNARSAKFRLVAILLFLGQFLLNLMWSPLFFRAHQIGSAFNLLLLILVLAVVTTVFFGRIRRAAAWLMLPYLAWLCFAVILNKQIDLLNPNAETLVIPAASTQI